jgi:acyl transferase domain-containing protein/acyl carrier protein
VKGRTVFPASGYIEMALAAEDEAHRPSGAIVLENVTFSRPLILLPGQPTTVQLHLGTSDPQTSSFDIHARSPNAGERTVRWASHASGTLRRSGAGAADPSVCDMDSLRREFSDELSPAGIFGLFEQLGHEYGPSFRAIEQVWTQQNKSLGRVRLPASCESDCQRYTFHPVLLDACFQLVGVAATYQERAGANPWVPAGVDRLELYDRPGSELWALAEASVVDAQSARADVSVMAPDGRRIAQVVNLRLENTAAAGFQDDKDNVERWLYRIDWRPTETIAMAPSSYESPKASEIGAHLQDAVPSISSEYDLESYRDALRGLEQASLHYVLTALRRLGWTLRLGEHFSPDAKADALGIAPRHRRLFNRLIDILAEEGMAAPFGSHWEVTSADTEPGKEEHSPGSPLVEAERALLERCGPKLAEVLQGKCDPVELLFPRGDLTLAGRLYETATGARAMNALVQQAVSLTLARLSPTRTVRVMEIGGGTGGTTAAVVSSLPHERLEYLFTDISPSFINKARERFGRLPFMRFDVLDIERDPTTQGYGAGQFDVVVAANVLHATRDLRQSLDHVQTLLRAGGVLVLLEGTNRVRWVDLIFGLTEGWWRFSDTDVRPSYPLITLPAWKSLLGHAGLEDVTAVSPFMTKDGAESAVIIAQARSDEEQHKDSSRWLVFADRQGVGAQLANGLRAQGQSCTLVFAAPVFSRLADEEHELDPGSEDGFQRLFASLPAQATSALQGVVFLWSLDLDDPASPLSDSHRFACGSVLHLIKAVTAARLGRSCPLWLVTRGAVPAGAFMGPHALLQAPLWGMATVMRLEHPELRCTCVDLDGKDEREGAAILLNAIRSETSEDRIAIRDGTRYVARLVRHQMSADVAGPRLPLRTDASYLITGGLKGLGLLVARWMVDHGAREIVLLGRERPDDVASRVIRELRNRGATVTTVAADVTDTAAMARVVSEIDATLAPLRGVVHAAGLLEDGVLLNLTWERFQNVLAPKTVGAWILHTLTAASPLDFFVMFSSTASVLGSPGQANHAAANAYLDTLAHYRQAQGRPALSINWSAWSEVGSAVKGGIDARLETRGIGTISPQLGLEALRMLISSSAAQVAVAPVDWAAFCKSDSSPLITDLRPADVTLDEAPSSFRRQFEAVPLADKRPFLVEYVRSQVALIRGVAPSEIDLTRGLFELGLDSLMAIDLRKTLEESLGCSLPSTIAFDYPTVDALVDYIARDVLFVEGAPREPVSEADPKAALAAALEDLPADEIAARLNEKLVSLKRSQAT